ncbi:hypothetical protein HAX54_024622 [Datura stramonium]|uniref:Uncharacterized protein n=1 Tax=Datura stramonium TaxID=4076 RepID=A0ABS8RG73_DATST|nr:hypothetical protein [Datura stramonium]
MENFGGEEGSKSRKKSKLKQFLKRRRMKVSVQRNRRDKSSVWREEMKETQKKAEVEKELSKLEMKCHDMASLLLIGNHCLVVTLVMAFVKFTWIEFLIRYRRQLSEEEFKLISRMKDKYLPTI